MELFRNWLWNEGQMEHYSQVICKSSWVNAGGIDLTLTKLETE